MRLPQLTTQGVAQGIRAPPFSKSIVVGTRASVNVLPTGLGAQRRFAGGVTCNVTCSFCCWPVVASSAVVMQARGKLGCLVRNGRALGKNVQKRDAQDGALN